jgi:hypothetical protein
MACLSACDPILSTGEAIDCPVHLAALLATIEWESVQDRRDPERPNQKWIERFRSETEYADVVVRTENKIPAP